jgi:CubicO group peptidase (beta-lactamase class C family)
MEPDKFQQAWQSQAARSRVTVDANLLLNEVLRNQQTFQGTILGRDIGEIVVGLGLIPVWFFMGAVLSLPWSWYLTVPACLWVAGFIAIDRIRHKPRQIGPGEPLIQSVRASLADVEHQIWLLRNVFWWYLLPFVISLFTFFIHVAWLSSSNIWSAIFPGLFVAALYTGIYSLNQRAMRTQLIPRRQELLALLSSLQNESSTADQEEFHTEESLADPVDRPAWQSIISNVVLAAGVVVIASITAFLAGKAIAGYPKVSPFTAVRWEDSQPEVEVNGEWFKLVSIDDVSITKIIDFSKTTYGDLWQKRFGEDLVELMAGMGHEPSESVRLAVVPLFPKDAKEQILEDVPLTEANRRAIKYEALKNEFRVEPQVTYDGPAQSSGPKGDWLAKLVTEQRKEKNLVGLAAMVMIDGQVEAVAAQGERKIDSAVPLDVDDRWHLGGIAKSITATMIARLIEAGKMNWDDTVGEIFPDDSVHENWRQVTIKQLLTDMAGAPRSFSIEIRRQHPALGTESTKARRKAVLEVLADQPDYPPGEKNVYSNVSMTIAATMAEKVTGETWEDLMKREVFEPLHLKGSGFGPPTSSDEKLEQPRGHRNVRHLKVASNDKRDNTFIMSPAGAIHMTLGDLCTYAMEHLRGELGDGQLLSADSYQRLHTPELDRQASGWVKKEPSTDIPYTVYWHNGTNTMWYALVAFIPDRNMVVAVTSNDGDFELAEVAAWEIVEATVKSSDDGQ